ncbi:hypothetical protein [Halobacillus massiliensis]|uniref:hypothetical protein n=1 Tax=Halobacillus massiliensis TaxID=1926286 RepID=UPI00117A3A25|nr:hypothetical protein [Halobacillus massiliensis]
MNDYLFKLVDAPLTAKDIFIPSNNIRTDLEEKRDDFFHEEKLSILRDVVSSMEGESSEESFKDYYFSQKEMTDFTEKVSSPLHSPEEDSPFTNEKDQSLYDEFFSMLSESSNTDNHSDHYERMGDDTLDESSSSSSEQNLHYNSECQTLADEFSKILENSSTIDEESKEERTESLKVNHQIVKEHTYIVKAPVLLSHVTLNLDVMDSFHVTDDIVEILNIDWSLDSAEAKVLLPSSQVFFSGVLMADIDYISTSELNTIHSVKIPIHWSKTVNVKWQTAPILSTSDEKEYTFSSHDKQQEITHYEFYQQFANPLEDQVKSIQFTWHNSSYPKNKDQKISLQGTAEVCIDLFQNQYVYY